MLDQLSSHKRLKPVVSTAAALLLLLGNVACPWTNRNVVAAEPKDDEASKALEDGKAALKSHYTKDAIELCTKAIKLRPDNAEAYVCRAQAEGNKWDFDKAIADCTKAIELRRDYAEAYRVRGSAYLSKHQYDKAIADLSEAIRIDPKDAKAYSFRGDSYRDKGDPTKAIADYSESIRVDPKNAVIYGCRGSAYGMIGEFDKASQDFHRGIEVAPHDWNVRNNFGVILWMQAQRQDMQAAKAEAAGDANAASDCRQKSSDFKDQAVAQWLEAIKANPAAVDVFSNLGYAFSDFSVMADTKGNLEDAEEFLKEAEDYLTKAVKLNPEASRPRNNLGRVILRRSQACGAKAKIAEAKGKTDPSQAEIARQLKADAKVKRNAALAQFEKAVELDPSLMEAHLNLGQVYFDLNELDKAETQYMAILELPPPQARDAEAISNVSQAHFGLGRVAMAKKKTDEAIKQLRDALAVDPQNRAALTFFSTVEYERGDAREGEKYLLASMALAPRVQRWMSAEAIGQQLEDKGKTKEAVAALNYAAWVLATSPDAKMHDPHGAVVLARQIAGKADKKDPLYLDTLAAALAADGQFDQATPAAADALDLAKAQGDKSHAEAIGRRLELYRKGQAYIGDR